jgi:hypothetical protein
VNEIMTAPATVNGETVAVGQIVATGGRYCGEILTVTPLDSGATEVRTDLGYLLTLRSWQTLDVVEWQPSYDKWRHGGWYVTNVHYASGAAGCVSRNYADRKWRIVCDPRPAEEQQTYPSRDAAARAERDLTLAGA